MAWGPPWGLPPEGLGDRVLAAVAGLAPQAGAGGGSGGGTRGEVRARRGVAVTAGNVRRMPAATVTAVAPSLPCHRRRPHSRGSPWPLLCARPTPPSGWPRRAERVNDLTLLRVCPAAARAGGQGDGRGSARPSSPLTGGIEAQRETAVAGSLADQRPTLTLEVHGCRFEPHLTGTKRPVDVMRQKDDSPPRGLWTGPGGQSGEPGPRHGALGDVPPLYHSQSYWQPCLTYPAPVKLEGDNTWELFANIESSLISPEGWFSPRTFHPRCPTQRPKSGLSLQEALSEAGPRGGGHRPPLLRGENRLRDTGPDLRQTSASSCCSAPVRELVGCAR